MYYIKQSLNRFLQMWHPLYKTITATLKDRKVLFFYVTQYILRVYFLGVPCMGVLCVEWIFDIAESVAAIAAPPF